LMERDFQATELDRRLANIVRLGTVEQADYAKARIRVRCGDMLTGWLPWLTTRAGKDITWWAPDIGEQVVVLSPSGEPAQGVVLFAVYQNSSPQPETDVNRRKVVFEDGTTVIYDRASHLLSVDIKGDVKIDVTGKVDMKVVGETKVKAAFIHLNPGA